LAQNIRVKGYQVVSAADWLCFCIVFSMLSAFAILDL